MKIQMKIHLFTIITVLVFLLGIFYMVFFFDDTTFSNERLFVITDIITVNGRECVFDTTEGKINVRGWEPCAVQTGDVLYRYHCDGWTCNVVQPQWEIERQEVTR